MSGPSTYRHSIPQQLAAVDALAVILRTANTRGLESIAWTVSDLGSTLIGRDSRPVGEAQRRLTFRAYVELLEELRDESVARYGPGRPERMPTRLKVRETPVRPGAVHLVANLEHVTIPLERDRKVWLLSIFVTADLYPDLAEEVRDGA
jgi:hypothetical protein